MIDPIEKSDPDIDQRPFEIEVLAARYRAERDLAIQERERLEKEVGLLRDAEHERDMLRDLADVLVVKAIERPCVRTFAEGLDDAEINDRIDSIIDAIDRRLMPDGIEWPMFEDDEPVRFGDGFLDHQGNVRSVLTIKMWQEGGFEIGTGQGTYDWHSAGERVRRPAPKVLDADGVEIRVGETVWDTETGCGRTVRAVNNNETIEFDGYANRGWFAKFFTHRAPVLDADGTPLREGEHVYHVETGAELVVKELPKPGEYQAVVVFAPPASHLTSFDPDQLTHERPVLDADGMSIHEGDTVWLTDGRGPWEVSRIVYADQLRVICDDEENGHLNAYPEQLTHTKPEPPDSWEQLKADIYKEIEMQWTLRTTKDWIELMARDLVLRAKALAGEGR